MTKDLNQALAVAFRVLCELWNGRRSLVFWALFPTLMLILFGLIYEDGSGTGSSFDRTAPGILIGAAFFFSCLGGPITTIVAERERNTLMRLQLSPLSGAAYLGGIALAYLTIAGGQAVIVYGIAFAFGASFKGSVLLGLVVVVLSVACYVGLGFFFGSRLSKTTEEVNGPVAAIGVPLLVLGGTFFPPSVLPPYLLRIAHFNPIFHMNEAMKLVSADGASISAVSDHLAFLGLFCLVTLTLGARAYCKMALTRRRT